MTSKLLKPRQKFGLELVFAMLMTVTFAGCSGVFRERATETPPPTVSAVEKNFFREAGGKPKTFLCAWAPEVGVGLYGEMFTLPYVNNAAHCNIEFEITQDALIGKMINPSFPDDRSKWKQVLRIGISKHYYYEKRKDDKGRDTNEWIENDQRSEWAARPLVKLDFNRVEAFDFFEPGGMTQQKFEEVEWDNERGFFAFSTTGVSRIPGVETELQGKFRFNFLRFEHDPTFQKVPFHQENSRHMNILHVMGRTIDGTEPDLYAAHWDLRKPTKIYITGASATQATIIKGALERWNKAFREIGAIPADKSAFVPEVKDLKHPFDLRYPSITWINDTRLSLNAPLGIGMAHADVRNGKILWGGIVIWGGMLEKFVNTFSASEGLSGAAVSMPQQSALQTSLAALFPRSLPFMPKLDQMNFAAQPAISQGLFDQHQTHLMDELKGLQGAAVQNRPMADQISGLKAQLEKLQAKDPRLAGVVADLVNHSQAEVAGVSRYFQGASVHNHLGSMIAKNRGGGFVDHLDKAGEKELAAVLREGNADRRAELLRGVLPKTSAITVDKERTIENLAAGLLNSRARGTRSSSEILESVIMNLTLHEIGHVLGLGHQFKENIVPEKGTVPSRFVEEMARKATAENEFTNYTSVMGYQNARSEIAITTAEINPGPHDKLVLRYLYNGQYAAFDKEKDDWTYIKMPVSGRIPLTTKVGEKQLPTSYFPQCNDIEASFGADPFCNRFDRGSRAEDIVSGYFEAISDNLLTNLYSLVGGSGNREYAEYRLWATSLGTIGRVRLFYDEMRRRLRSDEELKPLWNQLRKDKDALLSFSRACQLDNPTTAKNKTLAKLFERKDIVDLCRANALALKEFEFFVNLPEADYTKIDHANRYVSGGYLVGDAPRNFGRIFGSWYQLTNLPLKITSIYGLTSADPFLFMAPYLIPNYFYEHEDNRFLYRTLYPREYTKLISNAVQNNLRFAATGLDDTTIMGRTVLALGGMLPWQAMRANESARLLDDYNKLLREQTEFQYSIVAVLVDATKPESNANVKADHYKKFTATIYDFMTSKSTTAREVYILPNGNVFVWANGMFLFPVTQLKFYSGTSSYAIAYKVSYDFRKGDELGADSIKSKLMEVHDQIAGRCVEGFGGSGLRSYFDSSVSDFQGFYIPPGIADEKGQEKIGQFLASIDKAFESYDATKRVPDGFPIKSMRGVCDESLRGIGEISASAALINGFWLGITPDYLVK